MNAVFVVACDTCEMEGPTLRNHLGNVAVLQASDGGAGEAWAAFLNAHGWHQLRLYMEAPPRGYIKATR